MKKTQAFLVIGFVIAAALAIGFFTQAQEERKARIRTENMLSAVMEEKDIIEVTMNKKLQDKERQLSYLSASLSKEKLINSKLAQNMGRSGKRFFASSRNKKPVELEKIIISSLLEAEGKVIAVDRQNDLVVINLGSVNNLRTGDRLSVYRGDSFITNAELVKVQDRISAAMILPANGSKDIKVELNDRVNSFK